MRRTPMCLAIHRACAPQSCEESQIITPILHVKTDTQEVHMVGTGRHALSQGLPGSKVWPPDQWVRRPSH